MPVQNRIIKVQKRNRALVTFDESRIGAAILRAVESIGGFKQDFLPGINDKIFEAHGADDKIAEFLADTVVVCLNSDPHHLIANFPPTIETIQDEVLHALRSYGFQNTADAYACYRWGRHWLREGAINETQFVGNGFPRKRMEKSAEWNRQRGCHTVAALNELVRAANSNRSSTTRSRCTKRRWTTRRKKSCTDLTPATASGCCGSPGRVPLAKPRPLSNSPERLKKHGLRFVMLNLDDYFWALIEHPTDWINDRNFETPEALDIQLLNQHLRQLLGRPRHRSPAVQFQGRPPHRIEVGEAGKRSSPLARLPARFVSADD